MKQIKKDPNKVIFRRQWKKTCLFLVLVSQSLMDYYNINVLLFSERVIAHTNVLIKNTIWLVVKINNMFNKRYILNNMFASIIIFIYVSAR